MKTAFLCAAAVLLLGVPAMAQSPTKESPKIATTISPGELTPTPEMWFYEQYQRQYEDPKNGVRAKAEFRADQRLRRLAAQKWFGFSNQRPKASPDPFNSDYSASWSSNNQHYPLRWNGVGYPRVVVVPSETRTY